MRGSEYAQLAAFAAIVEHGTFVKAAAHLGISPSALSQTIRELETRLGVRLLNRTTRSVAASTAGLRLLTRLQPALNEIQAAVTDAQSLRDRPSGPLRINVARHPTMRILAPVLGRFHAAYPDVLVDIVVDDTLTDIVAGRFDCGIRLGERLQKDMIAVRLGGELRMQVVASPAYLARHGAPQTPADLHRHRCLNGRMPTAGNVYRWEFEKDGAAVEIAVEGPLICNVMEVLRSAAVDGMGIAYLFETELEAELASGALVPLLSDWSPPFPGYFLYYPSREHQPAALQAFVAFLRRETAVAAG